MLLYSIGTIMYRKERIGVPSRLEIQGIWRLLDKHNKDSTELVCTRVELAAAKHLLSIYSSPCFSIKFR